MINKRKRTFLVTILSGCALTAITGCANGPRSENTNDYLLIARPALIVPPEYKLRPPEAGTSRPAGIDEVPGISQTFGANIGLGASPIEVALIKAANAVAVSPVIREQIDYEAAATIRKPGRIGNNIREFDTNPDAQNAASRDAATGGEIVTIGTVSKLPGT